MMKKGLIVMLILILAVVSAACGTDNKSNGAQSEGNKTAGEQPATETPAEAVELTYTHQLGETKVKKNPETVVVFDMGALDTLDKLGVNVTALPQSNVPTYLEKYKGSQYKNAGALTEPDFEAVAALNPDLIIISARQSASYEEFTKIGPTLFVGLDYNNFMESFAANVKMLGEIFGKEVEAEKHLADIQSAVKNLHEKASANNVEGLIVLTTGGKVSAYGPGSRFGMIHDEFGVTPVDTNIEVSTHGMSISFEYIAQMNPDYLFVVDRDAVVSGGGASAKEVIENELVKNTNAYKNGNIVYLDPSYWYLAGGGLISVAEMVKEIEEGLK